MVLLRQGESLASGCLVQSSLEVMLFQSPPIIPEGLVLIKSVGRISPQNFSRLDLLIPSVPDGRYTFPNVAEPMSKMITLPDSWRMRFSMDNELSQPSQAQAKPS